MAVLYIAEFAGTYADHGRGGSAAFAPPVTEQTVAIGGGSLSSAAFNAGTTLIRVHSDVISSIKIGSAPTATLTTSRLAAGQTEYYAVRPGDKIAVIANT